MAIFSTSSNSSTPALNAYTFFQHWLGYAFEPAETSYAPALIRYHDLFVSGSGRFATEDITELSGAGLTVQSGPFAITGGTVTGFSDYNASGFFVPTNFTRVDATGFSIAGTDFWNLASTSQWHALWLLATAGDDTMTGSEVAFVSDFIEGGGGSDTISARGGNDSLWGNAGRDFLYGGDDNDTVVCNDWAAGGVSALWSEGHGDAGDDFIFTGGYGSGFLNGGAGSDRMWGGPQQDFLTGGSGIDYLAGGAGLDVFEVTAAGDVAGEYDFILDFQDGVDFIKLPVGAAWNVGDSAFGAIISDPLTGFYLIVQYATVATVSDQIYYA